MNEYMTHYEANINSGNYYCIDFMMNPNVRQHPHVNKYYEIVLITSADQFNVTLSEKTPLSYPSLLLIKPGDQHYILNTSSQPVRLCLIDFTQELLDSITNLLKPSKTFEKVLNSKFLNVPITPDSENLLISEFNYLKLISSNPDYASLHANYLIFMILVKFLASSFINSPFENFDYFKLQQIPVWLSNVCNKMHRMENFSQDVSHMAELAMCSKGHLCRSMKKYLNVSPLEFITEIRLNYIDTQLKTSNVSIVEIFTAAGYSDLSWSYSLFKKKFDVSPAVRRKKFLSSPLPK